MGHALPSVVVGVSGSALGRPPNTSAFPDGPRVWCVHNPALELCGLGVHHPRSFRSLRKAGRKSKALRDRDTGSAMVEFLASLVLLAVLLTSAVEIGIYAYVRNLAQAAAAEAARAAAPYGRDITAARGRIDELLPEVLGQYARGAEVRVGQQGDFVIVSVRGKFSPSTPLLPELPLRAEAWAFREERAVQHK